MANRRFLICMITLMILFIMIKQSYEIYVDCVAQCMLKTGREYNRHTLQICQDQCEIIKLLSKEDAKEGKEIDYRLF